MIYYYTALVVSYALNGEAVETVVWYDRERHCQEAMSVVDPLYSQLYDLYGNDIMVSCFVSEKVSHVLRPKLRPEELSNG